MMDSPNPLLQKQIPSSLADLVGEVILYMLYNMFDLTSSLRMTFRLCLTAAVLLNVACQHTPHKAKPIYSAAELSRLRQEDKKTFQEIKSDDTDLRRGFLSLKATGNWKQRGYFSAQESDEIEHLLFRFNTTQRVLINIVERSNLAMIKMPQADSLNQKTQRQLSDQAKFLVATFAGDSVAIDKLNHRYPRSDIEPRTYDRLADISRNRLGRGIVTLGRKMEDGLDGSSYEIRAGVFERLSRWKKPSAHLIHFSDEQKKRVIDLLQPGDVLLSYTAGYASGLFIPGEFKHAMVYVGDANTRLKMGMDFSQVHLPSGSSGRREVTKNFKQKTTKDGRQADLIEAVAEGVKFSNLEHIMDTHVNRLLVLRPKLTFKERTVYLARVFSYLGQEYDFRFDFADASRQVCTEVVYRALNGIDGIDLPLIHHSGHLTMSADDLVHYWLEDKPDGFEFIFHAEERALSTNHGAHIRTGAKGMRRLKLVMHR
ncbi:MAG: hypothetical protein ACI9E1_000809 [Cryomorphaceae bacterium]|jgi:hypothetical protein